jgi:putative acetyltransferase
MQKHYARSIHILGCITTRYKFLILPWRCGKQRPPSNQADATSSPVLMKEVVGHLALDIMENPGGHVATFGIGVSAEKHGRGVGSALMREMVNLCDNWLRIERIELTVFVDNAPALTLYQKFGFEIEGTGKRFALRNGEYVDAYFMARIKQ